MADWYLNPALTVLITALRLMFPGITIYTIGDASHAAKKSDHNPNEYGRVNAVDIMLRGPFTALLAKWLVKLLIRDPRTKYLIHDGKIWQGGKWYAYGGSDPHTDHIHLSVFDSAHTDTKPWDLGEDDMTPEELLKYDGVTNRFSDAATNPTITVETALENASRASAAERHALAASEGVAQLLARPVTVPGSVTLSAAQLDRVADQVVAKLAAGFELAFRPAS